MIFYPIYYDGILKSRAANQSRAANEVRAPAPREINHTHTQKKTPQGRRGIKMMKFHRRRRCIRTIKRAILFFYAAASCLVLDFHITQWTRARGATFCV